MFSCLSNFAATLAEASGIVTCIKPAALRICRISFAMLIMWEAAGGLEHPVVVVRVTMFRLTPRMACGGAIRGCRCPGLGVVGTGAGGIEYLYIGISSALTSHQPPRVRTHNP